MSYKVQSVVDLGISGILIDVECKLSNNLPNIVIVGLAARAVDEAKERVRSALASADIKIPRKRIIINLAPADLPKDSTSFDLAIALSILCADHQVDGSNLNDSCLIGELGLGGQVRPVRGLIGKLLAVKKRGLTSCFVPQANAEQAKLIDGMDIFLVPSLKDMVLHLNQILELPKLKDRSLPGRSKSMPAVDLSEISGQAEAKRALMIAAAGHHNLLLSGPPGTGKTLLAKALLGILPPPNRKEILEISQLHSLSQDNFNQIIYDRPLRSPHHSTSHIAIVGGGQKPKPGEISLSHHGMLFLDELPEFSKQTLEALRQPLEDRIISVARAQSSMTFPANFMLVATANPCPCGFFGSSKECLCTAAQITKYQQKLSGPIIDRIDLFINVSEVDHQELLKTAANGEASQVAAESVNKARILQSKRNPLTKSNSELTNRDIKNNLKISVAARELLNKAAKQLNISARSYMRSLKVAQTIADIDNFDEIGPAQIAEALQYRRKDLRL